MDEADLGLLAMDLMDVDKVQTIARGSNLNLDELCESATLGHIKTTLNYIQAFKTATLDDGHLTPDFLEQLQNPPSSPVDLTPDEQLSLELFLSMQNTAQQVYISIMKSIEWQYPDSCLLSYEKVKRLTAEISGIFPITDHMCLNSCIAYTGPFSELESCPICNKSCFDSNRQPCQVVNTIPIGPQLQALKRERM
jgi:hypothetical protein